MKNHLITFALVLFTMTVVGQTKNKRFGITAGGSIQQYNGNLGNSFCKFNTTCFAGVTANFGLYLNRSLDLNLGSSIGDFGYCQTEADIIRTASYDQKCPGCKDKLGMGELRSRMTSANITIKYKFANGILLKEDSKVAPYVYAGVGVNHLADNMKRNCVNVGNHFTIIGGVGVKYNINDRFNISYNLGISCFVTKKVYVSGSTSEDHNNDKLDQKLEKRKDLCIQNSLSLGINF